MLLSRPQKEQNYSTEDENCQCLGTISKNGLSWNADQATLLWLKSAIEDFWHCLNHSCLCSTGTIWWHVSGVVMKTWLFIFQAILKLLFCKLKKEKKKVWTTQWVNFSWTQLNRSAPKQKYNFWLQSKGVLVYYSSFALFFFFFPLIKRCWFACWFCGVIVRSSSSTHMYQRSIPTPPLRCFAELPTIDRFGRSLIG